MSLQYVIAIGMVVFALIFFIRRLTAALRKQDGPGCGYGCNKKCRGRQGCHQP